MSKANEEVKSEVYGGFGFETGEQVEKVSKVEIEAKEQAGGLGEVETTQKSSNLPTTNGFWSRMKNFWLQDIPWNYEIKVELTPYQQKVEKEINDFLHQEITWGTIKNLFNFGKKK